MDAERVALVEVWSATSSCKGHSHGTPCPRCDAKAALAEYDRQAQETAQRGAPDQWMYLSDRTGHASFVNLDTGVVLNTREVTVKGECGLRRQRLRWVSLNQFEELPEFAPLTPEVLKLLRQHGGSANSWNIDPVCLPVEATSDDPAWYAETSARILDALQLMPYTPTLLGIQLRHLLYYSDGNYKSQQRYLSVVPLVPYASVWNAKWQLHKSIANAPTQAEVIEYADADIDEDAKAQNPLVLGTKSLEGSPLLWNGPAIVVRLLLDGQQAAFGGCRIYLDPTDLRVISSDWCQRAGRDMYDYGIDLQVREYDLPTWLISSCVPRAMTEGTFKPKTSKTKVIQLATMKKPAPVPTLAEALKKHESAVNRLLRTMTVEELLVQLREDLHPKGKNPRRAELHKVPMCLVPEFTADTRKLYENAVSDSSILCSGESVGLRGYTKADTVHVRAEYLMIDEARVRAKVLALSAAVPAPEVKKPLKPSKSKTKAKAKVAPQTAEEVEAQFLTMCGTSNS